MEAGSAERKSFALGGGGVEEARKPSERNAEGASVLQIDPEAVFVEANLRWAWQISHSMKPQCSVSLGGFGSGLAMVSLLRILPSRPRSEERRVGKECVSTVRSRGSQYH